MPSKAPKWRGVPEAEEAPPFSHWSLSIEHLLHPVLTPTELALVDQMAGLTGSKRTDVIKSALAVYHWFVRQALIGSRVVARKPTGEEVAIETAELAVLEGKGNRLSPEELGLLAKSLATASNPTEAARIKERLTRGFYGI